MTESQRDSGLVRAVGVWGLAASTINCVVAAGIFAVPSALAASIGSYAPLALLVGALAVGAVAICFAEAGSRVPTSGGAYGFVEEAFGPLGGHVAGTLLWVGNALAAGGLAAALADVAASAAPAPLAVPIRAGSVIAAIGGSALINIGGVTRGVRLVNILTAAKLIPLVIFVVAGVAAVHGANLRLDLPSNTGHLGRAILLGVFAFTGMEVSLSPSGEVAQPSRTIPRALAIALGSATVLYIAIQVVAQGILGPALAHSTVPLADAMGHINPALRLLMLVGAAVSMLGYLSSDLLSTPRVLFALSRDGVLPSFLGRVDTRSHTPRVAILTYAAIVLSLALSGTFAELAVLSTLATAALYVGGCAAAWRLRSSAVALAGQPLNFRGLRGVAIAGIGSMLILTALASRTEILGLFALMLLSVAAYLLTSRRPGVLSAVRSPGDLPAEQPARTEPASEKY